MTGRHFREYHLLLDERSDQIYAMTNNVAEPARKSAARHSFNRQGNQRSRLKDNNHKFVAPGSNDGGIVQTNQSLTQSNAGTHEICDPHGDVATASMLEVWIDQAERRT